MTGIKARLLRNSLVVASRSRRAVPAEPGVYTDSRCAADALSKHRDGINPAERRQSAFWRQLSFALVGLSNGALSESDGLYGAVCSFLAGRSGQLRARFIWIDVWLQNTRREDSWRLLSLAKRWLSGGNRIFVAKWSSACGKSKTRRLSFDDKFCF